MYKTLTSIQRDIFISLLLLANHLEKTWEWKGETYTCKPGQFITSLESIKKLCSKNVKTQNIRTALDKFMKWSFLTNESTKTGRLITILNWETYQVELKETNKDANKELTKNQQRANKELTTNKNVKNVKNDKKKDIKRFVVPTVDDITNYCNERKNTINPQTFIDHYTSNGWMIGKNKMKDWKASVRTWEQRNNGGGNYESNNSRGTGQVTQKAGKPRGDGNPYPIDAEF